MFVAIGLGLRQAKDVDLWMDYNFPAVSRSLDTAGKVRIPGFCSS